VVIVAVSITLLKVAVILLVTAMPVALLAGTTDVTVGADVSAAGVELSAPHPVIKTATIRSSPINIVLVVFIILISLIYGFVTALESKTTAVCDNNLPCTLAPVANVISV
jgi:hypothetical protein